MLIEEVTKHRQDIRTQSYSMSVGELASMYLAGEMNVHPEFQRSFRWTGTQKSRLVESILLGIPIPPIYVSQQPSGKWDVIDGQQRLSTLLELMGVFKDAAGNLQPALTLEGTNLLPSLNGRTWTSSSGDDFSEEVQLIIKRSRLDVVIILRESSSRSKYELFRRLNTGGASLSDQEKRSCLWLMENAAFFDWATALSNYAPFSFATSLSDHQLGERHDLELVTRALVFSSGAPASGFNELSDYLDDQSLELAKMFGASDLTPLKGAFETAFALINDTLSDGAFRRFDPRSSTFKGAFSISAYEVLAIGAIQRLLTGHSVTPAGISGLARSIWSHPEFVKNSGSGVRASTRIPVTLRLGRELLN